MNQTHDQQRRHTEAQALKDAADEMTLPYGCELRPDGTEDPEAAAAVRMNEEFIQQLYNRAHRIENGR